MDRLRTETEELRDRALVLANEHGVDPASWYVRVLEEGRKEHLEPDLGALVRAYWSSSASPAGPICATNGAASPTSCGRATRPERDLNTA